LDTKLINKVLRLLYEKERLGRKTTLTTLSDELYLVNFHPFSYPSNLTKNLGSVYGAIKMVYPSKSNWVVNEMLNSAILYDKIEIKQVNKKIIIFI